MKVLHYNWVDYLDPEKRGGGVSVYQRNTMEALARESGVETNFLSAGLSYDFFGGSPRWEALRHGPKEAPTPRFEIVNSGTIAPSHHSFYQPSQLDHDETAAVFFDFVQETGPYDIIHFNNLEGLPSQVLELKKRWPGTKVIFSLHNYYPMCPQVNFWYQERAHCDDYRDGSACATCLPPQPPERLLLKAHGLGYLLKKNGIAPGSKVFDQTFRVVFGTGRAWLKLVRLFRKAPGPSGAADGEAETRARSSHFRHRRTVNVDRINKYCDAVLCVSDRVRQIAVDYGIRPDLAVTSYIGTKQDAKFRETRPRPDILRADGTIGLGYLGYMRADKGFFFLLDALEALPDDILNRIHLLIAARSGPMDVMARIEALRPRLAGLTHEDGYSHDNLDDLAASIDLGLIPVLWEDNLPQVAIEMHARHVPLLTSDKGGAREVAPFAELTFKAGDTDAFADRLSWVLDGNFDPDAYWATARAPTGMDEHLEALRMIYGLAPQSSRAEAKELLVQGTERSAS